jgi:TonB family protein
MKLKSIAAAFIFLILQSTLTNAFAANSLYKIQASQSVKRTEAELRAEAIARLPHYISPLAKAARISGNVVVEVTVDENGDVVSAMAISGHPLLKDSAATAAKGWKFNPLRVDDKPVKKMGTLSFTFDENTPSPAYTKKGKVFSEAEQEKLKRVEEAADRFIQRWHETLDLNVLFHEMYVSDPKQKSRNAYLFYGVYQFLSASAYQPKVAKDIDESVMREAFFAFWNLYYLRREYTLAFVDIERVDQEDSRNELETQDPYEIMKIPPEIAAAMKDFKKLKLNPKSMTLLAVKDFIGRANYISLLHRKYLFKESFASELYQKNLKRQEEDFDDEVVFSIQLGFPEYEIASDVEVYHLRRGFFEFCFIEEEGQLKVLTLLFEL